MLDLSQFLVEGASLHFDLRRLGGLEVAFADVDTLQILDHFEGNNEGYGYKIGEEEKPAAPGNQQISVVVDVLIEILMHIVVLILYVDECAEESEDHLHNEDVYDNDPHFELQS